MMRFFHRVHRTLGQVLSVLFVLWFLTGFVMIYHNFPRITERVRHHGLAACETSSISADVRYFNANTRARKWTYQALHSFSVKWLLDRPVLWHLLMFGSMAGGTVVSLTGLWLLLRRLRRMRRKRGE